MQSRSGSDYPATPKASYDQMFQSDKGTLYVMAPVISAIENKVSRLVEIIMYMSSSFICHIHVSGIMHNDLHLHHTCTVPRVLVQQNLVCAATTPPSRDCCVLCGNKHLS